MQDFLNRFFGGQGGQGGDDDGDGGGMPGAERRALGSGFIVDPSGYIITNNHVVDKADKIYVKLSSDPDGGPDAEGRLAKVIGTDKDTDIAVIKIDTDKPLPTVKLGNSDGAHLAEYRSHSFKSSFRPTLRSIRATQAARWLICLARSLA